VFNILNLNLTVRRQLYSQQYSSRSS